MGNEHGDVDIILGQTELLLIFRDGYERASQDNTADLIPICSAGINVGGQDIHRR